MINFLIGSSFTSKSLALTLRQEKFAFDVIHIHDLLSMVFFLVLRRTMRLQIPGVFTVHGFSARKIHYSGMKRWVVIFGTAINRFVWKRADILIVLGAIPKNELVSQWGVDQNKIRVVEQGVNPSFFHPGVEGVVETKEKYGLPEKYCIFVGLLIKVKGVEFLIKAMTTLDLMCVIVGDGEDRREFEDLARDVCTTGNVKFTGLLPVTEIRKLYAGASFFVLPSMKEGSPLVILEAMASGLPVISTNVGGIPSVVHDGVDGFIVEPGNHVELADRMRLLDTNEELRRQMGKNARTAAVTQFAWSIVATKTAAIYKKLAQDSTG
jgi:glycosyltransferase involved in cell wall biosynthesis